MTPSPTRFFFANRFYQPHTQHKSVERRKKAHFMLCFPSEINFGLCFFLFFRDDLRDGQRRFGQQALHLPLQVQRRHPLRVHVGPGPPDGAQGLVLHAGGRHRAPRGRTGQVGKLRARVPHPAGRQGKAEAAPASGGRIDAKAGGQG